MRKFTKTTALLLAFSILLCSCDTGDNAGNKIVVTTSLEGKPVLVGDIPCEFPLTDDDTSMNIMMCGYDKVNTENVYVMKKYEEMTGVDINWINITKAERDEKVSTALLNKSDIDLFMRCQTSASKLLQYGSSGLILDLAKDDLLKNNAPNCWTYLQSHPDALASVTNPDGSIYALPQINSGTELRVSRKLFINKNWLAKVNMDVPTTTEELYELAKAFKEQDANGNGDPDDEIPICMFDLVSLQDSLMGAFGLCNRGVHNQIADCDESTGKVRLIAASDSYRDFLEYLNRLYSDKLLDNNIFTISMDEWFNNTVNDRVGIFGCTNLAVVPADKADNWVSVGEALEGPNGDKLWSAVRANFHSTGAAVIPSTCKNPELVLKWLDYFWTDEGTLFYHMGIEGDTFTAKKDGSYDYSQKIYDEINSGTKSFDDVVAEYSPYPGGGNPTVEVAPYFLGGEMADLPASTAQKLFKYGPKEYWPSFTFTAEENESLDIVQTDITKYCDTAKIDFVTGAKSFDQWDSYTEQLDNLGKDRLLTIYQAAVDRYHELSKAHEQ